MSTPPRITTVGTQTVNDTTSEVAINAQRGLLTTVAITATDAESDPITCEAFFLQDGMSFNPDSCKLSWTPSAPVGTKFYVKFRVTTNTWPTASGGSDAIIVEFTVTQPSLSRAQMAQGKEPALKVESFGHGRFALTTPLFRGAPATLSVFDLTGRRIATVRGESGSPLVWEGRDRNGGLVPPGIYTYRTEAGRHRYEGKIVIVR